MFDAIEQSGGTFDEVMAADVVAQTLEAIRYIHCNGVAHRDLKVRILSAKQHINPCNSQRIFSS